MTKLTDDKLITKVKCDYIMKLKCLDCGYEDEISEYETGKEWDNDGNHILYYICPKCSKIIHTN